MSNSQFLAQQLDEHDSGGNIKAKRVKNYVFNSSTGLWERESATSYTTQRYDVQGSTIYEATASVGTADASTGWTITKYDLSDMTDASGKVATDVSWNDRATGSYA